MLRIAWRWAEARQPVRRLILQTTLKGVMKRNMDPLGVALIILACAIVIASIMFLGLFEMIWPGGAMGMQRT